MDMISIDDFKKLDLRVAEILSVEEHPNADRLYVLKVKVGDALKQIVAGIRAHYGKDELVGKKIVVVNNLAPVTLRGVESQGMLLASSNPDTLCLLVPERPIADGSVVR